MESAAVTVTRPLSVNGTTYAIPPMSYELRGKFGAWLETNADLRIRARRESMTPAEYEEERAVFQRDLAAMVYADGTATWFKAINQPPGAREAIRLLINKGNPGADVTPAEVDAIFNAAAKDCWSVLKWAIDGPFDQPAP